MIGIPEAAVHRHILDRMNAINDSFKKKKQMIGWPSMWELSILWLGGDVVLSLCWHQAPVQCGWNESQVPPLLVPPNVGKGALDVRYLLRKIDILVHVAVAILLVLSPSRSTFRLLSYLRFSKNSLVC